MTKALHKTRNRLAEAIAHNEANDLDYTRDHRFLCREYRTVCRAIRKLERLEAKRLRGRHE